MRNNIEYFWTDLGTGLFLYEGNILVNPKLIGNLVVGKTMVVDFFKATYLGKTWREVLIILQSANISEFLKSSNITFFMDLDDHGICADGIMGFETKNGQVEFEHFVSDQVSTFVSFSCIEHNYIKYSISYGMHLFQENYLLDRKNILLKSIEECRKYFEKSSNIDIEDLGGYYEQMNYASNELDTIEKKLKFIKNPIK